MAIKVKAKTMLFHKLKRVEEGQVLYIQKPEQFSAVGMLLMDGKKALSFRDNKSFKDYYKKNKKGLQEEEPVTEEEVVEVSDSLDANDSPQDQEVI